LSYQKNYYFKKQGCEIKTALYKNQNHEKATIDHCRNTGIRFSAIMYFTGTENSALTELLDFCWIPALIGILALSAGIMKMNKAKS
jgi:hypothetical protein